MYGSVKKTNHYLCNPMSEFYQDFKLGVLGGGQLGRMLIQQAINYNLHVEVMDADPAAPCSALANGFTCAPITDYEAVLAFGRQCDLVTIEIENVNVEALHQLAAEGIPVYPQPEVIGLIRDKVKQKQFYRQHGIPTAPFREVQNRQEVHDCGLPMPFVNKLATAGYDGRGVQVIRSEADLSQVFDAPGLVEEFVDFDKEIAVIVARNRAGEIAVFPVVELEFHPQQNLVEYLKMPARLPAAVELAARELAVEVIKKLDMTGLLAVEMFVTRDRQVLVNEVAPRTHNSGHQTIEACATSQFDQHLRAILNLPLGDTTLHTPAMMVNLLGERGHTGPARYEGLREVLARPGVHVHLYGKAVTKPYRKMGHVTITGRHEDKLQETAKFVKETLKVKT